jgi:hypothetical protein
MLQKYQIADLKVYQLLPWLAKNVVLAKMVLE